MPRCVIREVPQSRRAGGLVLGDGPLGFIPQFLRQWRIGRLGARLAALFRKPPVAASLRIFPQRLVVGEHCLVLPPVALVLLAELRQRSKRGVVVANQVVDQTRLALGLDEEKVRKRRSGFVVADQVIPTFGIDQMVRQFA